MPEYHQLDFWLGDWDAYDSGDPKLVAHLTVPPVVAGCALQEDYQQSDGIKGRSVSGYDARALISTEHKASGEALMRSSWRAVDGNVREWADESTENGATWTPLFDMISNPHQAANVQ